MHKQPFQLLHIDQRAGGGHEVQVTLATQPAPMAGDMRLLGTSSAFVFLWWPGEQRAEAVPIESISRIATLPAAVRATSPAPRKVAAATTKRVQ